MRKRTIIAKCLLNSEMVVRLEDGESVVQQVFLDEFLTSNFSEWNQDLDDKTAEGIIRNVGRASRINVKKFIQDF